MEEQNEGETIQEGEIEEAVEDTGFSDAPSSDTGDEDLEPVEEPDEDAAGE